ncbi:MAG: c-type cytochrome [Phycisphaerales bacterium]|nr:c-type cytochrome [Phycisphaerales bacterium]
MQPLAPPVVTPPLLAWRDAARASGLPAGLLMLLALELAVFTGLLATYAVAVHSYPDALRLPTPGRPHWGVLLLAVSALAALSALIAGHCTRQGARLPAVLLLTATLLYGVVLLGALASEHAARNARAQHGRVVDLGLLLAELRSAGAHAPALPAAEPVATTPVTGDAALGRQAYNNSCAACHGPQGQGLPALAPGLREAPFVRTATDAQLYAVIVDGRAAAAPDSVSGRVMPPRGGNPFLSDTDVRNIIAFLHELTGGGTTDAVAAAVDSATRIPQWVVPWPADGPIGLAPEVRTGPVTAAAHLPLFSLSAPWWRPLDTLYLIFTGLFALHVLFGIASCAWLLLRVGMGPVDSKILAVSHTAGVQWVAAAVAWIVILPLFHFWR